MTEARFRYLPLGRRWVVLLVVGSALAAVAAAVAVRAVADDRSQLPATKQAALARLQPTNNGQPPAPKDPTYRPKPTPLERPMHAGEVGTQGSLGGVPVPFSSSSFRLTNMWLDLRGDVYYGIYAVSLTDDPSQGALLVDLTNGETGEDPPGSGEYKTPQKLGPISLSSVEGDVVNFTFADGGRGSFDLRTHRFSLN